VANLRRIKRICFRNLDVKYVRGALVRSIWWTGNLTAQLSEAIVLQLQLDMAFGHLQRCTMLTTNIATFQHNFN